MTWILGINAYHGDAAAVLLRDGRLVAAVAEERFRRVKHWAGFPTDSVRECLRIAGIDGSAIDHVAIGRDPRAHRLRKAVFLLRRRPSVRLVADRLANARAVGSIDGPLAAALDLTVGSCPPIHRVEHHPAHLASAFYTSPFHRAAVCALDGFGDFVSTSLAAGEGSELRVLERVHFPHSLGIFYTALTQYLGFPNYGDEFKVMGLAAHGEPEFADALRRLVRLKRDGGFALDLDFFRHGSGHVAMEWSDGYPVLGVLYSEDLERWLGPARAPGDPITDRHRNLASSLQRVYEDAFFHVLHGLARRVDDPRLCLAGGCALNSVANGKIRERTPFDEVFIQPAASDDGTALGAALSVWHRTLGRRRSFIMEHGFWGSDYDEATVIRAVSRGLPSERCRVGRPRTLHDLCRETARLIADGQVVGWHRGRMEWGPRALGHRSILADPRREDARDLLNRKVKFREPFRPFALSILEEAIDDYFADAAADPFMVQVYPVRPERRATIPAVTHVDGTARLQAVRETTDPAFYRLIREFAVRTGVPVLLNTSFNENEPIVRSPGEAIDCFLRTDLDALVLGPLLIRKIGAADERADRVPKKTGIEAREVEPAWRG